ncbi:MAG: UvrB/UvrC motif-containing protein, partial [Candidatus Omnitrophota bacterium]
EKDFIERLDLEEKDMQIREVIAQLEKEMYIAAKNLQFERAARLRDKVKELKDAHNIKNKENGTSFKNH